jgi:hypothetical protein
LVAKSVGERGVRKGTEDGHRGRAKKIGGKNEDITRKERTRTGMKYEDWKIGIHLGNQRQLPESSQYKLPSSG